MGFGDTMGPGSVVQGIVCGHGKMIQAPKGTESGSELERSYSILNFQRVVTLCMKSYRSIQICNFAFTALSKESKLVPNSYATFFLAWR